MPSDPFIRMPQLGLTMTEGTLVEWLIEPGQPVSEGELLYIVETDKIVNEIPADRSGTFGRGIVPAGETVAVGTVVGCWQVDGKLPALDATDETAPMPIPAAATPASDRRDTAGAAAPLAGGTVTSRVVATPHARKLAREHGIDITRVHGTGPKGRIRGSDIVIALEAGAAARPAAAAAEGPPAPQPLSATQRTIARRMTASKRDVPHFYLTADAEISELLHYHEFLKQKPGMPRLTLTHWIATAVGLVIAEVPLYRTVFAEEAHLVLPDPDVGIAVATGTGLYAPVARNVGRHTLADNAEQIERLVERTRRHELSTADLSGGATTVSNLGGLNISRVFPIINPGQSSVLGIGRTGELFRPDAEGKPALHRELTLALACDHRVYNGIDGARLLDAIVTLLEDPLLILARTRGG